MKDKMFICARHSKLRNGSGLNSCPNKSNHKTSKGGGSMSFSPNFSYAMTFACNKLEQPHRCLQHNEHSKRQKAGALYGVSEEKPLVYRRQKLRRQI
jgi:hypothetical protein